MLGLILFAHGARDPRWAQPFESVKRRLQELAPAQPTALAYLEFLAPDLEQAAAEMAAAGCHEVRILPLFLGAGGHVRKDLPAKVEALKLRHPAVDWVLRPAAGESALLIEALAAIALQSCEPRLAAPSSTLQTAGAVDGPSGTA